MTFPARANTVLEPGRGFLLAALLFTSCAGPRSDSPPAAVPAPGEAAAAAEVARLEVLAIQAHRQGDDDAKRRVLAALVALRPDHPAANFYLAELELAENRHDEAAARLERVARQRPADPQVRFLLATAHIARGRFDAARGELAVARSILPTARQAVLLARLALLAGRLEEARRELDEAASCWPDDPTVHAALGAYYRQAGDLEGSRDHLERAVALDPGLRVAHHDLALTYRGLGRAEAARSALAAFEALERREEDVVLAATR